MLILVAVFALQGCNDSDDTNVDNGLRMGKASKMMLYRDSIPVDNLTFSIGKGSVIIGIDTDGEWTAEAADTSWCKLAVHAGYGYVNKFSYNKVAVEKNNGEARSTTVTFRSGDISKTITITQKGTGTDPGDNFISAFNFVEALGMGYNLGNTLESNHDITNPSVLEWFNPKTVYDWETAWGQPVTTQEIINAIAERGFNVIRVPVTWFPHMDAEDNIDPAWMNRVKEVVDMVLAAGCYCIINVHHDASEPDASRGDGAHWLVADLDQYDAISARFKKIWTQIAVSFKDYDDRLVFEAANEVLDKNGNWGDTNDPNAYVALNKLLQDFVDAVRATGGNNEFRNLMVNPYSAGSTAAKLNGFQLPVDKHANHLMASVHSYDPYWFCNDSSDKNAEIYYIYIFDSAVQQEIDDIFARVNKRFSEELGVPYIFGEFAAGGTHVAMSERAKYAKYMKQKFNQYETTGLWWMGLMDRTNLQWYESEIVDALF